LNKAESAIRRAVETLGMEHFEGIEAAFGKLDFIVRDALDRVAAGYGTSGLQLAERFDLSTWQRMALANAR